MKPMAIIVLVVAVVGVGLVISDYIPRREDPQTKLLKNAIQHAAERQAAAENALKAKEQELDHLHTLVVHDTAQVHRQKLAYYFGRTHVDTTSIDSLKKQLTRADSVVDSQARALTDALAETQAAHEALALAKRALAAADYRADRLDELNRGVQRELDQKNRDQWKHDAKVVGATLAVRAAIQLVRR